MMTIDLLKITPGPVGEACRALWEALPLQSAMSRLVVSSSRLNVAALGPMVELALANPAMKNRPELASALWLYIDELDKSHVISQGIETPTGSYWHGIMHRREGDFSNSHYWFRRVGKHPVIEWVGEDYDPHRLIDEAEIAHGRGEDEARLVDLQRREWATLWKFSCEMK